MNELKFFKKNVTFKRKIELVNVKFYRMQQEIRAESNYLATIVTAENWILTNINCPKGSIAFKVNNEEIKINHTEFTLFIPPLSIVQFNLLPGTISTFGISSALPTKYQTPFVTEILNLDQLSKNNFENIKINSDFFIEVPRCFGPSKISKITKDTISKDFISTLSINSIAKKMQVDVEIVSRHFKKDFGITPVEYRSKIRVTRAIERLILGASIIETSMLVGFSDLSRFYKQFKKITSVSPKKYQI